MKRKRFILREHNINDIFRESVVKAIIKDDTNLPLVILNPNLVTKDSHTVIAFGDTIELDLEKGLWKVTRSVKNLCKYGK